MSLPLLHLYACMRIIYMYDPPPNFDTNPRSKKKHKTLENAGQPHQTRVHGGGGVPYIYIYISYIHMCNVYIYIYVSHDERLVPVAPPRRDLIPGLRPADAQDLAKLAQERDAGN